MKIKLEDSFFTIETVAVYDGYIICRITFSGNIIGDFLIKITKNHFISECTIQSNTNIQFSDDIKRKLFEYYDLVVTK